MEWYQIVVFIPSSLIMNDTGNFSKCIISLCLLKEKKTIKV